jgi:hypothetical protein
MGVFHDRVTLLIVEDEPKTIAAASQPVDTVGSAVEDRT